MLNVHVEKSGWEKTNKGYRNLVPDFESPIERPCAEWNHEIKHARYPPYLRLGVLGGC